jgi:hypothetical protein
MHVGRRRAPSKLMKRLKWIAGTFLYDEVWLRFRLEISHRAPQRSPSSRCRRLSRDRGSFRLGVPC